MISTLIIITMGFVLGLLYSRGKIDPLQSAILDALRIVRKIKDASMNLIRKIKQG